MKNKLIEEIESLPYVTISHKDMLWNKTGTWKYRKPYYETKLALCAGKCPVGNDIPGFIHYAGLGEFEKGYEILKLTNPLPGVCGRVCYHPCEINCNRNQFDNPVAVQSIERFLADYMSDKQSGVPEINKKSGKRTAVVGSGPAGLSFAYHLALKGHDVVMYEAYEKAGGMLQYGIPSYRLPKEVLDREIQDIINLGVELRTNVRIGKDLTIEHLDEYDAVYVAVGAHASRLLGLPDEGGVLPGVEFLRRINGGDAVSPGKRVVVIGGGNTAVDAARSALRFGSDVTVVYRRSREEMPAWSEEVDDAITEGVQFVFLAAPVEIIREGGVVGDVKFQRMRLGEPDESGRRKPLPVEDDYFSLGADTVISAIGEESDIEFLPQSIEVKGKKIITDGYCFSGHKNYFAGGDAVLGVTAAVSSAIGSGRLGAEAVDARFGNEEMKDSDSAQVTEFKDLNTAYSKHAARIVIPKAEAGKRKANFTEIVGALSPEEIVYEAGRCFNCGMCTECDICVVFCPDLAIKRKRGGYEIDYDYCKGCGICVEECPRNVISSERETIRNVIK